jgi:micrococcal nuclease
MDAFDDGVCLGVVPIARDLVCAEAMMLALLLSVALLGSKPLDCKYVRLIDGDSFVVLDTQGRECKIRLAYIDAPEYQQPFGGDARAKLGSLLIGKLITVEVISTDNRGRKIARVIADGIDVNLEMVASGSAWWYKQYAPKATEIQAAELDACERKLGLWGDADPTEPWVWRKRESRRHSN